MESSTRSTEFLFCRRCGLQRVCDVAEELQRLFSERQLDPDTCGICQKLLEETNNATDPDVHLKLEQINDTSTRNSKLQQSDANHQSESDTENYALTAEDHIQPSDSIEPEDEVTQGGERKLLSNSSSVIKNETLNDTVVVSWKPEAPSEEQPEPVVKKLKSIYQKKKKVKRKKPVKNVNPEVVQATTDESHEAQPQRRATRLRTGALQARQYTNPQNDEFSTDEEELGDVDSDTTSEESSKEELEDECIKEEPKEKTQDDEYEEEEAKEVLQDDEPDENMKAAVQKMMQMEEDPKILALVKSLLDEAKKQIHEFLVPELLDSTEPSDDPTRPVQCKVCKTNFLAIAPFLKHLANHTGKQPMEKPLKCTECGQTFAVKNYKTHGCKRRFKHSQKCIYKGCRYRYWDKSAFISHVDVHRGVKRFICRHGGCGQGFFSMKDLVNHRPIHSSKNKRLNKHVCHICNQRYRKKEFLNEHNKRLHKIVKPKPSVECDECGRVFMSASHLKAHKKWHKKQPRNSLFCGICNEPFAQQSALDKHLKSQKCKTPDPEDFEAATKYVDPVLLGLADMPLQKDKLFRCKICSKKKAEFLYASLFLVHMKGMHPETDCPVTHPYRCDQCPKKFLQRSDITNYVLIHSSIKPFKCDFENCEAAFKRFDYLKLHQVTHRDPKDRLKHICHICGSALSTNSKLKHHIQTVHASKDKPKPFKCSYCNEGFFQMARLRYHENLRHLNIRAYVCEVCGKSFKENSQLTTHNYSHTGERPFACKLCDYRCARMDYLRKHERTHTGEKPYVCDICEMRFLDRTRLNAHTKTNHKAMSVPKAQSKEVLSKSDSAPQMESREMLKNQSEPTATFVPPSEPRGTWQVHGETSSVNVSTSNVPCPPPAQSEVELACQNIAVEFPEGVMGRMQVPGIQVQNFIQMLE